MFKTITKRNKKEKLQFVYSAENCVTIKMIIVMEKKSNRIKKMNEIHFYILIKVYDKNSFFYFLLFYYLWNLELFFVNLIEALL